MYELCPAGERTFYINCPAKIGVYLQDGAQAYLIDSGSDKDAGRRVRKIAEEHGWTVKGILNTHSNADHIGGNAYLQKQTGCKIFSGGIEKCFTEHPLLEPSFLYGGYPCDPLRNKFLMARESRAEDFSHEDFPKEVEILPLPGHFFDMVGFKTPDGVIFLADCLSSRETLEKYGICFIYDVAGYLDTLEKVGKMEARLFVPAHAEASEDISELARYNKAKVMETAEIIMEICRRPSCFEAVLQSLFARYGLNMDLNQYVLAGSTVRSYLSWLYNSGELTAFFDNNMLLWSSADRDKA
ncbi:MAG: MBL fold metallo-hydrolase [Ruminococcus sp.]|nr:MBL fold metallo-hydrolase [Ruminococcus sp.]